MQAADRLDANGTQVSNSAFATDGWYPVQVPATVLAGLVAVGEYPDLYVGKNLDAVPKERFAQPWWYRCAFDVNADHAGETTLLDFNGINYAANIWLNGERIADADQVRGAFRRFSLNVSEWIQPGTNLLAVEVIPPRPGDFSTGFVDWNPLAPDRNMGIFRPVTLRHCGGAAVEKPFVQTKLETETLARASLTVSAELCNHTGQVITGILKARVDDVVLQQTVTLAAGARQTVEFTPAEHGGLQFDHPRLWWPHDMGEAHLYDLDLSFQIEDTVSDVCHTRFGIRCVEDNFNDGGHRGFKINGRKVLIRAGGWTDDILLADAPEKLEAQIKYVKHMNLNCVRLEGVWGTDQTLYDLCDAYGILMMVGWSCHWEHEQWLGRPVDERFGGIVEPQDIDLIAQSWRDQVLWLRHHPSIFVWTVGSDKVPHPDLEQRYVQVFDRYDRTRPYLASTGGVGSEQAIIGSDEVVSDISGPTGVKMLGPYAYTPPIYWYEDTQRGGAYGFNTETGPGAQVPILDTLRKMFPAEDLWPINDSWDFHCGLAEFSTLDRFCQALERRYGGPDSVEQFAYRAQILNYELIRPMFEAFRVNRGKATGVVQWMLNAAWPKLYWQLYDWYLMPTGALYGTRTACQPCQLIYDYARRSVVLANDSEYYRDLHAHIRILDIEAQERLTQTLQLEVRPDSVYTLLHVPNLPDISPTYFLDLSLCDAQSRQIGHNFYWLSTQSDILDYEAKVEPWEYYTPSKQYADYRLLNTLPSSALEVRPELSSEGEHRILCVTLKNSGPSLAFGIELQVNDSQTGTAIVPVFWDDNYFSLIPGESRTIACSFRAAGSNVTLAIQGWNIEALSCTIPVA